MIQLDNFWFIILLVIIICVLYFVNNNQDTIETFYAKKKSKAQLEKERQEKEAKIRDSQISKLRSDVDNNKNNITNNIKDIQKLKDQVEKIIEFTAS